MESQFLLIVTTSGIALGITIIAAVIITIVIAVCYSNYTSVIGIITKLIKTVISSTIWATWNTISSIISSILSLISLPIPFNIIILAIIVATFVAGIIAFTLIGQIQVIANNVVQIVIEFGNDIAVDGRESIKDELIVPMTGYVNIFSSTVTEVTEEFVDYMCPDGVLLNCKGVYQIRFLIDALIIYYTYLIGLIGQALQGLAIIVKEWLCNGKVLFGGLDEYACFIEGTPLKAIPRVFLQQNSRSFFRRSAIKIAFVLIPQSFKVIKVPIFPDYSGDLSSDELNEDHLRRIRRRMTNAQNENFDGSNNRRLINGTITEGGFDLSDPSEYLTYYYLETTGYWEWIQLFLIIMGDILDVFFNIIIEYIILIWLVLLTLMLLYVKIALVTLSIITLVFGNIMFSIAFMLRGYIWPEIALQNAVNATLPERNVEFVDTALSQTLMLFISGIDPIEMLVTNNVTGWNPPGSPEVRAVIIDVLRFIEDVGYQIMINLPHLLVFIDKSICILLHPIPCAADYQLCKLLFDGSTGIVTPLVDSTSAIGNILLPIGGIVIGYVWFLIKLFIDANIGEQPILPTEWTPGGLETLCELKFYTSEHSCICNACAYDISTVSGSILAIFEWGLTKGAPCLPFSEERCCLFISPQYKSYDQYCNYRTGSTYQSIFPTLFPGIYETYTVDAITPFNCRAWSSVINTYDKILLYGINNTFIGQGYSTATQTAANTIYNDYHIGKIHSAKGRHPFGFEMERCSEDLITCPDSHRVGVTYEEEFIPKLCEELGFERKVETSLAPISPVDGCIFYVISLSNCYGKRHTIFPKDANIGEVRVEFGNLWLQQNLICPDGYKIAQKIAEGASKVVFRKHYMCTVMESWINEVRGSYIFKIFRKNVEDSQATIPYKYLWQSNKLSPMLNIQPQEMILDYLDNVELFCEMNDLLSGCVEALTNMSFNFTDIRNYDICDSGIDSGSSYQWENFHMFPNRFDDNIVDINTSPYVNPYEYLRKPYIRELYRSISYYMYTAFCMTLIEPVLLTNMFETTTQVERYYELLSQDPREVPIDKVVVHVLNSLVDGQYPWGEDKETWPCNPQSETEDSDMYKNEHTLTQFFMAMDYFIYNKRFSGEALKKFFDLNIGAAGKVPGSNSSILCDWLTPLEMYWNCDNTGFFEDPGFDQLSNWETNYALGLNLAPRIPFMKFLIGDLRRNFESTGTDFMDAAETIYFSYDTIGYDQELYAISSILFNLNELLQIGEWETNVMPTWKNFVASEHGITNSTNQTLIEEIVNDEIESSIDAAIIECKDHSLNAQFCNNIGWGMKQNIELRDCIFNPYDNKASDCAYIWYENFYNHGKGLEIKNMIPTFDYAREIG